MRKVSKLTKKKTDNKKELKVLLTFLKTTKKGKYALVEKSSIPYSRLNDQPDVTSDEFYFYGLV